MSRPRVCSFSGGSCAAPATHHVPSYWTRGSVAAQAQGSTSRFLCAEHGEVFAAMNPTLRVVPLEHPPTHCGGCAGTGKVRNPNTGVTEAHRVCAGKGVR